MTDTDCNRKIVRTQCFVSLIVTQCLFRLLQGAVTAGNPPYNPFTVAIQQIGMQVSLQSPLHILLHLLAVAYFLIQLFVIRTTQRKAFVHHKGIIDVPFTQVIFGNDGEAFVVGQQSLDLRQVVEVQLQRKQIQKIQVSRMYFKETIQILHILPHNIFEPLVFRHKLLFTVLNHFHSLTVKLGHHHLAVLFRQLHDAEVQRILVGIAHKRRKRHCFEYIVKLRTFAEGRTESRMMGIER